MTTRVALLMLGMISLAGCSSGGSDRLAAMAAPTYGDVQPTVVAVSLATMASFGKAVAEWNRAGALVAADLNDPNTDAEHFEQRTSSDRLALRITVAQMHGAITPGTDPALAAALRNLADSYGQKIIAIDQLAHAISQGNVGAGGVNDALDAVKEADRMKAIALPGLLAAARPYLTDSEEAVWATAFGQ